MKNKTTSGKKKTRYTPKPFSESKKKEIPVVVVPEVIDNHGEIQSTTPIVVSPMDPATLCKELKINGINLNFLKKKYAGRSYVLKTWEEILQKEKITY